MTEATPASKRRRRAPMSALQQKLKAPERKGWVRRWVNNDPARIEHMKELGYDLVNDRAGTGENTHTDGLGTRLERYAGKRESGEPYNLVLMECRQEDYDLGVREKDEAGRAVEAAINAGVDTTGRLTQQYTPSTRSSITTG